MKKGYKVLALAFLISMASWAVFHLANKASTDLVAGFGIQNEYLQYFIVIGFVVVVALLFFGKKLGKVVADILKT
jgi:hypothetical protein